MKEPLTSKKRLNLIVIATVIICLMLGIAMCIKVGKPKSYDFTLSERDVAMKVDDSVQLKVIPDEDANKNARVDVLWTSSKPSVATVKDDGSIVAVSGGESRITAVVKLGEKEYSASCMVTVKEEGLQYSNYKIRWFTQRPDRSGYDVTEEVFERLVGSEVELTKKEANKLLPANYALNVEKSTLKGVVQEKLGISVLEVYYDVAEITYSVDYFYESATALGTYTEKVTKNYKAYAFSEVSVPGNDKTGFVMNTKVKGSVLNSDSVVSGTKLKAYYDRVRSTVNVSYVSGKKSASYINVFGVGLVDAPKSALQDSLAPYYVAGYVDGEKVESITDAVKKLTADAKVEFKVDGVGFTYTDGVLLNTSDKRNVSSYAYLQGKSDVIYLAATYNTTGSTSNMFGITLKSGGISRELRFQHEGLGIMKDHTNKAGTLLEKNAIYGYNTAGRNSTTYVFAQNTNGANGTVKNSVIYNMVTNTKEGSYDVVWVVWEGTLYVMVEGEVSIALPLNLLDTSWTADKKYEIGFSAFDGEGLEDELKISNVDVYYGKDAEAKLVTDKCIDITVAKSMIYEPITGTYMPASSSGAGYVYGTKTNENIGISADVKWTNKYNSVSAAGVTVQVGDKSVQYVLEGMGTNTQVRRHENHGWNPFTSVGRVVLKYTEVSPCDDNGNYNVKAMVKDGYFYIFYNDVQAVCVNMQSLFEGYAPDMEVSVGICTWDACNGQSYFANVKELSKEDVEQAATEQWSYYTEGTYVDDFDYATGTVDKLYSSGQNLVLMGSAKVWELEGVLTRPEASGQEIGGLPFGFEISSGDKTVRIMGQHRGFFRVLNGWLTGNKTQTYTTGETIGIFQHNGGADTYAFNDVTSKFFSDVDARTLNELSFKAVIYDDVLYVWFAGEICWRVPLTEEEFGGFEAGSDYKVSVQLDSGNKKGGVKDLTLKMGYQVTENPEFITYNNKAYTVDEVTKKIDKNVNRWNDLSRNRIAGSMAESVRYINDNAGAWGIANLKDSSSIWQMEGTMKRTKNTFQHIGFIITSENKSLRLYGQHYGFRGIANNNWSVPAYKYNGGLNTYAFGENTYPFFVQEKAAAKDSIDFKAVIYQDVFYLWLEGKIAWRVPLTETQFGGFEKDSVYNIAVSFGDQGNVKVSMEDLVIKTGEQVTKQNKFFTYNDKSYSFVETIATIDANVTKWNDTENMKNMRIVGAMADKVTSLSAEGTSYAYLKETVSGEQALKVTIKLDDTSKTNVSTGITLQHVTSGATSQIIAESNNTVRIQYNHSWGVPVWVTDQIPNDSKPYKSGVCEVTAVVKNSNLYVLYNGKQAGSIELYKILPGYKSGDAIKFGVCGWDSNTGTAKFSNVQLLKGQDVSKITTTNSKWDVEFMVAQNSESTIDYVNGKITKKNNNQPIVRFLGNSSTWEVSGTIERTDARNAGDMLSGFRVQVGNTVLRLLAQHKGICFPWNFTWNGGGGINKYAFNQNTAKFTENNRTVDRMNFKAIIANDVLYVWLGFEGEALVPSWRVPLNQKIVAKNNANTVLFNGFSTGSSYNFGIEMANGATRGNFQNLKVKTGDAVDLSAVTTFETYYSTLGF